MTAKKHKSRRRRMPVHKRVLLSPAAVFILLCFGVMLVLSTFTASADSFLVKARVPGVAPSQPAVIESPADGQHVSATPINVSGSCPTQTYIKIYRNGLMSGSALCQADGHFSLEVDLSSRSNQLIARIFNLADLEGPLSTPVTVYYDVPASQAEAVISGSSQPPAAEQPAIAPFTISSDFNYVGIFDGQEFKINLVAAGGEAPYAFTVFWGDGQQSTLVRKDGAPFSAAHTYKKPGGYKGSYTIKVQGTDSQGSQAFLQLFAIVNYKNSPETVYINRQNPTIFNSIFSVPAKWLVAAWPVYGVVSLMSVSFWLGEHQGIYLLSRAWFLKFRR